MNETEEKKIRYLEMVQNIVSRMASNSFSLKSWTVTLVVGILALSSKEADKNFLYFALIPIVVFWFLDSYYLQLERKYRALFDCVRKAPDNNIDFDMSFEKIRDQIKVNKKLKYYSCFFSDTEWLFYASTGLVILVVMKLTNVF